jgi:hypothetical protein
VFIGGPGLLLQEQPRLVPQGARRDARRVKGCHHTPDPKRLLAVHDAGRGVAGLLPRDPQLDIGHLEEAGFIRDEIQGLPAVAVPILPRQNDPVVVAGGADADGEAAGEGVAADIDGVAHRSRLEGWQAHVVR